MLKHSTFYERYEDMSPDGKLSLFMERDGDVIITVCAPSKPDPFNDIHSGRLSVQFCTGPGGGQSQRVLKALRALMQAVEEDNAENPQYREVGKR